jgi:uncharacterized protein (TIGR03437 family)
LQAISASVQIPARVIQGGAGQVNAMAPFNLNLSGTADLQVWSLNRTIAERLVFVPSVAPAILTQAGTGTQPCCCKIAG